MPHPAALDALQDTRQSIGRSGLSFASGGDDDAFGEEPAEVAPQTVYHGETRANLLTRQTTSRYGQDPAAARLSTPKVQK